MIPEDLRHELRKAVTSLENQPYRDMRPHLGTDGTVLHVVDPSLHCLVYGQTCCIPDERLGVEWENDDEASEKVIKGPTDGQVNWAYSTRFAWIPTAFHIQDGAPAKAQSYITNIDPSEKELYGIIEALVGRFSLIFKRVLSDMKLVGFHYRRRVHGRITYSDATPQEESEAVGDDEDRIKRFQETREYVLPTVPGHYSQHIWQLRPRLLSLSGKDVHMITL